MCYTGHINNNLRAGWSEDDFTFFFLVCSTRMLEINRQAFRKCTGFTLKIVTFRKRLKNEGKLVANRKTLYGWASLAGAVVWPETQHLFLYTSRIPEYWGWYVSVYALGNHHGERACACKMMTPPNSPPTHSLISIHLSPFYTLPDMTAFLQCFITTPICHPRPWPIPHQWIRARWGLDE